MKRTLQLLAHHQVRIEITLTVAVLLAALANYTNMQSGEQLLMITMVVLATFYFLGAYLPPTGTSVLSVIVTKIAGFSSAVCVVGLLFTFLHLQGALNMLVVGFIALAIAGLVLLYLWMTSKANDRFSLLVRIALLGGVTLSALLELLEQSRSVL